MTLMEFGSLLNLLHQVLEHWITCLGQLLKFMGVFSNPVFKFSGLYNMFSIEKWCGRRTGDLETYHGEKPTSFKRRVNRAHDQNIFEVFVGFVGMNVADHLAPHGLELLCHTLILLLGSPGAASERHEQFIGPEWLSAHEIVVT